MLGGCEPRLVLALGKALTKSDAALELTLAMTQPYGLLTCNLCWKEIKDGQYIITSCNHCFCMDHQNDERIKQSTCPGCGQHLPRQNGLTIARFRIEKEEENQLNGLQPDSVLQLFSNAIHFWVSQERTAAEFHRHHAKQESRRREEQKEQYRQHATELASEMDTLRRDKEAAESRQEELKHENRLLTEKYQEETHKVRMLQERVVDIKRKRGPESPMHESITYAHTCSRKHCNPFLPRASRAHTSSVRTRPGISKECHARRCTQPPTRRCPCRATPRHFHMAAPALPFA